MLRRKRPAASAPGVFGIPRASWRRWRCVEIVRRARQGSEVIALRFIMGKSAVARPNTHHTITYMPETVGDTTTTRIDAATLSAHNPTHADQLERKSPLPTRERTLALPAQNSVPDE